MKWGGVVTLHRRVTSGAWLCALPVQPPETGTRAVLLAGRLRRTGIVLAKLRPGQLAWVRRTAAHVREWLPSSGGCLLKTPYLMKSTLAHGKHLDQSPWSARSERHACSGGLKRRQQLSSPTHATPDTARRRATAIHQRHALIDSTLPASSWLRVIAVAAACPAPPAQPRPDASRGPGHHACKGRAGHDAAATSLDAVTDHF